MTYHHPARHYTGVRNNSGVSQESLRKYVPSIFAEEAHHSRSDRYEFIPTWEVLQRMQSEGFIITSAQQARTRVADKREFTKHLIRFRHRDWATQNGNRQVGDTTFEIILLNSHDGTSSYKLDAGLFKLVCFNGMVVSDGTFPGIHVHHKGRIADNVIDASYTVIEEAPKVMDHVKRWKEIALTKNEQELFAEQAAKVRFNVDTISDSPVTPVQLLSARRHDDNYPDLWNTFNRVQENCIKGGMQSRKRDINGNLHRRQVRSVKGIDQDMKLNKCLWELAKKMEELKNGTH